MSFLKEVGTSDYITCAAQTYRTLAPEDVPVGHPVEVFNRVYTEIADTDGVIDRSSFEPARYPGLLKSIQIFERCSDGRFKVRLMGTGVTRMLKGDFTGWYLDDYAVGDLLKHRTKEFNAAIDLCKPQFSMSVIRPEDGAEWDVYRGIFPARKSEQELVFVVLASDQERLTGAE